MINGYLEGAIAIFFLRYEKDYAHEQRSLKSEPALGACNKSSQAYKDDVQDGAIQA